jgi:hypothetical protein
VDHKDRSDGSAQDSDGQQGDEKLLHDDLREE